MILTSTAHRPAPSGDGIHVAIIMDGNGRWATARGLPRPAGHRAGTGSVRAVVEAAPALGISVLTLYAFSADNWQRPALEVRRLMSLFGAALRRETSECVRHGIRLSVIGRRDRLSPALVGAISRAELATAGGTSLHLRVAVDYSARAMIAQAAEVLRGSGGSVDGFSHALALVQHEATPVPPVDLLVRSGGDQRLSDFLLWECAYAELYFTPTLWPDFRATDLEQAVNNYRRRERRFGAIPLSASA